MANGPRVATTCTGINNRAQPVVFPAADNSAPNSNPADVTGASGCPGRRPPPVWSGPSPWLRDHYAVPAISMDTRFSPDFQV